jgi:hypothetical protein
MSGMRPSLQGGFRCEITRITVSGVLDELYSQLIPLSRVAVQARQSTEAGTVSILSSLWRAGMATPLRWLS